MGRTPRTELYCRAWLWALLTPGCYDRADRWGEQPAAVEAPGCEADALRCLGETLQRCTPSPERGEWQDQVRCADRDEVCVASLKRCAFCKPQSRSCDGQVPRICDADGSAWHEQEACDVDNGSLCRVGACVSPCQTARAHRSNVGCEYWAADLDNAVVSADLNAAAQQFAVVISNPQPDAPVSITIEQDDASPQQQHDVVVLLRDQIGPLGLEIFPLGPREVDGSPEGEFNTGTHSALTRSAYRITSTLPVVAYQFNPLENVNVFSNDASLLKPVEALLDDGTGVRNAYVVLGWPQTIASTDNPATNFSVEDDSELRSFVTVVGTRDDTLLELRPTARVIGAPGIPETQAGDTLSMILNAYDTLNLETDDFNADLTGTLIATDGPLVVFSGSEASDAPAFDEISERYCCADHLEEQLDNVRTSGKRFVAAVSANRTLALASAGASIGVVEAEDLFRVIATTEAGAHVSTTLHGGDGQFNLDGMGDFRQLGSARDFLLESDAPVMLANISVSQDKAGVPKRLAGGDPSLLIVPPVEQFRSDYVFLTPNNYAFDFLRIIAPPDARVVLDGRVVADIPGCSNGNPAGLVQSLAPEDQNGFTVYRCQLSFPVIDGSSQSEQVLLPGVQDDGVHQIVSDADIGVLVDGFDRNVSYSYAAGTELNQIVAR